MGKAGDEQEELFVTYKQIRSAGGHPFYELLNRILAKADFDRFVEAACQKFYAAKMGRPSIAPGIYFRCLLIGYFEGIDSERGIAWRIADSLSLRGFLRLPIDKNPPDHSTLSRTRRLMDSETHQEVFNWVLARLAEVQLVKGKTMGVDGTTLEANAALRSIVRRTDGQGYYEFLTELAKASGIETPTRGDLARLDRKRPKKGSNKDWVNPHEPDAEITKMKDGRTHLAHKQENVVDMDTGAVTAVTLAGGTAGDTKTVENSLEMAENNLADVRAQVDEKTRKNMAERITESVLDKGYHSNDVIARMTEAKIRTYISEPARGRRRWAGKPRELRDAVYANRRRIRGERGKALLRRRGELLERPFAHGLETGGMRRTHLRRHDNILKRVLIHTAGMNLSLLLRKLVGVGKPRCLQGRADLRALVLAALACLWVYLVTQWTALNWYRRWLPTSDDHDRPRQWGSCGQLPAVPAGAGGTFSTGC